jgi:hypothetical protein
MSGQSLKCAYCGVALPIAFYGVDAWRVGNGFVCNEFCADGLSLPNSDLGATLEPNRDSDEVRSSSP